MLPSSTTTNDSFFTFEIDVVAVLILVVVGWFGPQRNISSCVYFYLHTHTHARTLENKKKQIKNNIYIETKPKCYNDQKNKIQIEKKGKTTNNNNKKRCSLANLCTK